MGSKRQCKKFVLRIHRDQHVLGEDRANVALRSSRQPEEDDVLRLKAGKAIVDVSSSAFPEDLRKIPVPRWDRFKGAIHYRAFQNGEIGSALVEVTR